MSAEDRSALAHLDELMAEFEARRHAHLSAEAAAHGEDYLKHRTLALRFHRWGSELRPLRDEMRREFR